MARYRPLLFYLGLWAVGLLVGWFLLGPLVRHLLP